MRHRPDRLSPEERRHAIASILARGVLRLQLNRLPEPEPTPDSEAPESAKERLDLSASSSPDATTG